MARRLYPAADGPAVSLLPVSSLHTGLLGFCRDSKSQKFPQFLAELQDRFSEHGTVSRYRRAQKVVWHVRKHFSIFPAPTAVAPLHALQRSRDPAAGL